LTKVVEEIELRATVMEHIEKLSLQTCGSSTRRFPYLNRNRETIASRILTGRGPSGALEFVCTPTIFARQQRNFAVDFSTLQRNSGG
jgi:hypothetical protein